MKHQHVHYLDLQFLVPFQTVDYNVFLHTSLQVQVDGFTAFYVFFLDWT